MKSPIIRIATSADCSTIAVIYNKYLGTANMNLEPQDGAFYEILLQKQGARERLYVMTLEAEVIGWAIIKKYSDRLGYQYAAETSVYLDEDHIGRGLGTYFKKYVISACKELKYKRLVAKIWASNETSILYNKKLGYEEVGIQRKIGFVRGEWIDVIILQLILE